MFSFHLLVILQSIFVGKKMALSYFVFALEAIKKPNDLRTISELQMEYLANSMLPNTFKPFNWAP